MQEVGGRIFLLKMEGCLTSLTARGTHCRRSRKLSLALSNRALSLYELGSYHRPRVIPNHSSHGPCTHESHSYVRVACRICFDTIRALLCGYWVFFFFFGVILSAYAFSLH